MGCWVTNASYSAGAVAWLQKPISAGSLEAVWSTILGQIPKAPGLEDLDQLYPDRVQIEADAGPLLAPAPLRRSIIGASRCSEEQFYAFLFFG